MLCYSNGRVYSELCVCNDIGVLRGVLIGVFRGCVESVCLEGVLEQSR